MKKSLCCLILLSIVLSACRAQPAVPLSGAATAENTEAAHAPAVTLTPTTENSDPQEPAIPEVILSTVKAPVIAFEDLPTCGEELAPADSSTHPGENEKYVYQVTNGSGLSIFDGESKEIEAPDVAVSFLGLSRDGQRLAYSLSKVSEQDELEELQIVLYSLTGETTKKQVNLQELPFAILPGNILLAPLQTPDSYWNDDGTLSVLFVSTDQFHRDFHYYNALIDPLTGNWVDDGRRNFPDYDEYPQSQFSPDRQKAVYGYRVENGSGTDFGYRMITLPDQKVISDFPRLSVSSFLHIKWSPDHSAVVIAGYLTLFDETGIQIIDQEGGRIRNIYDDSYGGELYAIEWSPDGRYLGLITQASQAVMTVFDNRKNEYISQCVFNEELYPRGLTWSPDSQRIFVDFVESTTVIYDLQGRKIDQLPYGKVWMFPADNE